MKKLLLILVFCTLPGLSLAASLGRYFCETCSINLAYGASTMSEIDDAISFIKNIVNNRLIIWRPKDTIDICDGEGCLTVLYQGGNFYVPLGVHKDSRGKYKNAGPNTPNVSTNSNLSFDYYNGTVTGHYEWLDFYTDNRYTGSSDPRWVFDSMTVMTSTAYRMTVHYAIP